MTYFGEKGQIGIFELSFSIRLGLVMVLADGPLARDSLNIKIFLITH